MTEKNKIKKTEKRNIIINIALFSMILVCSVFIVINVVSCVNKKKENTIYFTGVGDSMLPTLSDGNIHAAVPYDNDMEIERGMIIGIPYSLYVSYNEKYDIDGHPDAAAKRVIGLPGDTLFYDEEKHILYINDEEYEEPYLMSQEYEWGIGIITVPENHIFVMGDNRTVSIDSRKIGCVSFDDIVGVVVIDGDS